MRLILRYVSKKFIIKLNNSTQTVINPKVDFNATQTSRQSRKPRKTLLEKLAR